MDSADNAVHSAGHSVNGAVADARIAAVTFVPTMLEQRQLPCSQVKRGS